MRREFNAILHLRDPNVEALPLQDILKDKIPAFEVYNIGLGKDFVPLLRKVQARIILVDHSSGSSSKVGKALKKALKVDKSIPFVLITDLKSEDAAIDLVSKGASEYIFKDRLKKIPLLIELYQEKNEGKFKILVENSSDAIIILSPAGQNTYVSPSIHRVLGYTQEEAVKLDFYDLLNSKEKKKIQEAVAIALEMPGVSNPAIEVCAQNKEGKLVCLEVTLTNLLEVSGVNGIAINLRDITEYLIAQDAIKESEEKYRSFFMNSMDGVLVTVTDGDIVAANPAACRMFQMTEEEICEKGRLGLVDPHDVRVKQAIEKRKLNGKVKAEITLIKKDGSKFPGEITSSVYKDSNKRNRTSMIIRDLSEKKLAEEERKFQSELLDKVGQAVYATDASGNVNYWNQSATKIYGWSKEEALGKNILDFTSLGKIKEKCRSIKEVLKTHNIWVGEVNAIRKDGKEFPSYVTETPVYSSKGELKGFLAISTDITDQKKTETKLRELNKNLENYTQELITANKGLEQFSFIVSHNLRAPVANLLGLRDIILQKDQPEEIREKFLGELFSNIDRLDKIIDDLNYILKNKTAVSEKKENVNFSELVNFIMSSINHLVKKEEVQIITDFSKAEEFSTVKSYMHSIFYNLIFNSIKYRKPEILPSIHVTSWKEKGSLMLSFKDNGLGIDLENKEDQLFRLYKRFHHHVEGKGMGLFMVKTQVEMLGGVISVISEENKGTEFILEFRENLTK